MALPARKLEDIDPDIRPNLHEIEGAGNTGQGRADLEAVKNQEHKPESLNSGKSVAEQEAKGSNVLKGPWKNKTSVAKDAANMLKPGALGKVKAIKNLVKKKGPLAAIITLVIGYFILMTIMLSPAYIIVQFKEALVDKLDLSLATMDTRTTKLLKSKTTSGACNSIAPILCKYRTMSVKQVDNFKKAGIEVISGGTSLTGRIKPSEFKFRGETISAKDFSNHVTINREFQKAVFRSYHPKFAGFADIMWNKAQRFLKIAESAIPDLRGSTFAEKVGDFDKNIADETKPIDPDDIDTDRHPVTGETLTDDVELDNLQKSIDNYRAAYDAGEKAAKKAAEESATGTVDEIMSLSKKAVNFLKLSDTAEMICNVYLAARAVSYASKIMRNVELAYYANDFLKLADQIKAGGASGVDSPNPETVAFYGTLLSSDVSTLDGSYEEKSATASWGYRYAAYNEVGPMPMSAKSFTVGGGLPGVFGVITDEINTHPWVLSSCRFVTSWLGSLLNFVAGVVLTFFTGGAYAEVAMAGKVSAKVAVQAAKKVATDVGRGIAVSATERGFWLQVALEVGMAYLPTLLKDIFIAKLTGPYMIGANAGDALTSGASGIMAMSAKFGGNAPIGYDQAVDYADYSETVAQKYNSLYADNSIANQFNGMDRNTFMGKIVATLAPYASKLSSLSGIFTSIASVSTKSLSSIFSPNSKAYYHSTEAEFKMCDDTEYEALGVATDPFCNVRYGIPPDMLENTDPEEVAANLLGEIRTLDQGTVVPFIDATEGNPEPVYEKFITNCINRTEPLVKSTTYRANSMTDYGGMGGRIDNGASECMFSTSHSVVDHPSSRCGNGWPGPAPSGVRDGEVSFAAWVEDTGVVCDPETGETTHIYHYYYVGNAYLYLYYIDQLRIERGMDDQT